MFNVQPQWDLRSRRTFPLPPPQCPLSKLYQQPPPLFLSDQGKQEFTATPRPNIMSSVIPFSPRTQSQQSKIKHLMQMLSLGAPPPPPLPYPGCQTSFKIRSTLKSSGGGVLNRKFGRVYGRCSISSRDKRLSRAKFSKGMSTVRDQDNFSANSIPVANQDITVPLPLKTYPPTTYEYPSSAHSRRNTAFGTGHPLKSSEASHYSPPSKCSFINNNTVTTQPQLSKHIPLASGLEERPNPCIPSTQLKLSTNQVSDYCQFPSANKEYTVECCDTSSMNLEACDRHSPIFTRRNPCHQNNSWKPTVTLDYEEVWSPGLVTEYKDIVNQKEVVFNPKLIDYDHGGENKVNYQIPETLAGNQKQEEDQSLKEIYSRKRLVGFV